MSEPDSTYTDSIGKPSDPVCLVTSRWPSMSAVAERTVSRSRASLTPPALPRPPAWTWALITQSLPPNDCAAATASSALLATLPAGTGIPYSRNTSFDWYSWRFIRPWHWLRKKSRYSLGIASASPLNTGVATRPDCAQLIESRPMPLVAAVPPAPTDLAWRVIGLVNLYRLLIPPSVYALYAFGGAESSFGAVRPELFLWTCIVYFTTGIAIVVAGRRLMPNLRATTFVHALVDAVAISLLMFSSGGVASGLGILFVVPVGAMALLADSRDAFLLAALVTMALFAQQIGGHVTGTASPYDYPTTGF